MIGRGGDERGEVQVVFRVMGRWGDRMETLLVMVMAFVSNGLHWLLYAH